MHHPFEAEAGGRHSFTMEVTNPYPNSKQEGGWPQDPRLTTDLDHDPKQEGGCPKVPHWTLEEGTVRLDGDNDGNKADPPLYGGRPRADMDATEVDLAPDPVLQQEGGWPQDPHLTVEEITV